MSELVRFAVVVVALVWPYQTTNAPVSIFVSEAHVAESANDCTASDVPSTYAVWCGTFEGSWYLTGNFSGLKVDAVVRRLDGSIGVYGTYRSKKNSWIVGGHVRPARIMENQLVVDHPSGGRSTYTLREDGKITHWYCRNREKRCLLSSQMATLKRID